MSELSFGDSVDEACSTRILELSETGAFIEECEFDLEPGHEGVLGIPLPGGAPWIAKVVVMNPGTSRRELRHPKIEHLTVLTRGYGVEFADLHDDELERLRDFLELLDGR